MQHCLVELGKRHVTIGVKFLLVIAPGLQIMEVLVVDVILLFESVALKRDTDPTRWIVKFVDLVLFLAEPGHVAFLHDDRVADFFGLSFVAVQRVVPGALDLAVQDFDHGGGLAVVVDWGGMAWGQISITYGMPGELPLAC